MLETYVYEIYGNDAAAAVCLCDHRLIFVNFFNL